MIPASAVKMKVAARIMFQILLWNVKEKRPVREKTVLTRYNIEMVMLIPII
jgi:hypothetical protein